MSVEYDVCACFGMFVWDMCACHVERTRVEDSVGSLCSLRCGVFARSNSVVLRLSMHVRSCRSESRGILCGSLASIASVFRM